MRGVWVELGIIEGGKIVDWISCMKENLFFFFNAKKRKMYLIDLDFHCIVYVSEILYVLRFRSPFLTLFPIYILFATY